MFALILVVSEAKGGGSGGGRGGGGRSYAYGGGGSRGGGGRISGKKLALGAAAVGVAGYAVHQHNQQKTHRFHSNCKFSIISSFL